ncbi:MAG: phosphoribosylformylglycinamidine synthase subunit PurL, partial [Chitinophagaceae bacterium]|nr:phosphoribosylformylglycinamidine synthase subunit PurL [Chitinophagaceae bacterium]
KGFCNNLGFEINTNKVSNYNSIRQDAFWFGEAQSRVVVTVSENIFQQLQAKATQANIAFTELGVVTTSAIKINNENFENSIAWKEKYDTAIEKYLA